MADVSQLISLGIGSPADIPHFILFGLSPGAAVVIEEPPSPVIGDERRIFPPWAPWEPVGVQHILNPRPIIVRARVEGRLTVETVLQAASGRARAHLRPPAVQLQVRYERASVAVKHQLCALARAWALEGQHRYNVRLLFNNGHSASDESVIARQRTQIEELETLLIIGMMVESGHERRNLENASLVPKA